MLLPLKSESLGQYNKMNEKNFGWIGLLTNQKPLTRITNFC